VFAPLRPILLNSSGETCVQRTATRHKMRMHRAIKDESPDEGWINYELRGRADRHNLTAEALGAKVGIS